MFMLLIYLHLGNGYLHHLGNWCFILNVYHHVVVYNLSFVILLPCYLYILVNVFYISDLNFCTAEGTRSVTENNSRIELLSSLLQQIGCLMQMVVSRYFY